MGGGDHIIFDRVWVHGTENAAETKSGFNFTGATNVAVISSYLNDFKCIAGKGGQCTDAHVFGGGDDAAGLPEGTWKIYNNFIEASGENIIFGGAKRGTTTPPDIEIRQNHFYKVPSWNRNDPNYSPPYQGSRGYIVKNLWEPTLLWNQLHAAGLPEGTWKIYNNFIEASGENIIFGGAKRGTTTPPDIEIRQNHFYKVPSWNRNDPNYTPPYQGSRGYIVKNLWEPTLLWNQLHSLRET